MPISVVAMPILTSVRISIDFRPRRSPKWLKIMAPIGRAKKPTPMVLIDMSVPTSGSLVGKKVY
jgi:hypothetical protein